MLKRVVLLYALACGVPLAAQFDLGVSFGMFHESLRSKESEGHAYVRFSDLSNPGPTASVFYRERSSDQLDLGVEVQYTRSVFTAIYSDGSVAGSVGASGEVELHLIHLTITPELRLNPSRTAVMRFGPQIGFLVDGSMTGYAWNSFPYQGSRTELQNAPASDFKGDVRVLFGLGLRSSATARVAVSFDPYFSASITSLLRQDPGAFSSEYGIRIGLVRRCKGRTLTQLISPPAQGPYPRPN